MIIIGVTGGIGSGKSTVSRVLYDLGARLVDADILSRKVTRTGNSAYNEIIALFGELVMSEKGVLDRKKLSDIVFNNDEDRKKFNSIVHKYIADEIYKKVERLKSENVEFAVVDAAIPVEKGFLDVVNEVWVVKADLEKRIERVIKRSSLSREKVQKIMDAQYSQEDYQRLGDVIIENNGTIQELENIVAKLFIQKKTG